MTATMTTETREKSDPLGDPTLRKQIADFVRRRVPVGDVDDVVQTVLLDALAAKTRPDDPEDLKKWVLGIARHKVVDLHRRAHREPLTEIPDLEASPPPIEERELARWAEEQAGSTRDAKRTLEWMAREGEGEKLETIAAEEQVPAARVRQRVSRMRRWMKERWLAELAAVAALTIGALVLVWLLRRSKEELEIVKPEKPVPTSTVPAPEPTSPLEQAKRMRDEALDKCAQQDWKGCLDELDRARDIDPEGDRDPVIGAARQKANDALAPAPTAPTAPTPTSSASLLPKLAPTNAKPTPFLKEDPKDSKSSDVTFGEKNATPGPSPQPKTTAAPPPATKGGSKKGKSEK